MPCVRGFYQNAAFLLVLTRVSAAMWGPVEDVLKTQEPVLSLDDVRDFSAPGLLQGNYYYGHVQKYERPTRIKGLDMFRGASMLPG